MIDVAATTLGPLGFWALMIALMSFGVYEAIRRRPLPWHREGYPCDQHCDERCNAGQEHSSDLRPEILRKAA